MSGQHSEDARFQFALHFVFGVVLGFFSLLASGLFFEGLPTLVWILVPLIVGLLGGLFGDRFWRWFLGWFE